MPKKTPVATDSDLFVIEVRIQNTEGGAGPVTPDSVSEILWEDVEAMTVEALDGEEQATFELTVVSIVPKDA